MKSVFLLLIIILSISLVSATQYVCYSLKENQLGCKHQLCPSCFNDKLQIVNPHYCQNINCIVYVEPVIETQTTELNIISPKDNEIRASRSILLELTSNNPVVLYYGSGTTGRWTRLAKNVTHYNRKFTFKEGLNNITIKSVDNEGNSLNKQINILVDSKQPLIRTYTRSKIINGSFAIKFQEDNFKHLRFFINNNSNEISFDNCKKDRSYFVCSFFVDLSEYNNMNVTYYFEVEDIVGNKDTTSKIKSKVKGGIENE